MHSQPHQGDERLKRAGRFLLHPNGYAGPKQPDLGGGEGEGRGETSEKLFTRLLYFLVLTKRGTLLDTVWTMNSPSLISLQLEMRKKIEKQTNICKAYLVK